MTNLEYATNAYRKTMVNTSESKLDLVILLYDGAIEFLHKAVFYMGQKDIAKKLHYMSKSIDIVTELLNSLNMKEGGQVAQRLQDLYIYMLKELTAANIRNDPEKIHRVQGLLRTLREGWKGIR